MLCVRFLLKLKKMNKETKKHLKYIIDLGGDGKIDFIDISLWFMTITFSLLLFYSLYLTLFECYFTFIIKLKLLLNLSKYFIPLTQIFGTLVTLVYSIAFMFSSNSSLNSSLNSSSSSTSSTSTSKSNDNFINNFFDFDKDGKIGLVDILCTVTSTIHAGLIIFDMFLWYGGYFTINDVVDFIAADTRLIVLLLTKSYLAYHRDPTKYTRLMFFFDVNHDGSVDYVDLVAFSFNISYILTVIYAYFYLTFSPIGQSDVNNLIVLTSQLHLVLISAFASVYLSKLFITAEKKRILEITSLLFLILLIRTLIEMSTNSDVFKVVVKLANGLVLGVTQLCLGSYLVHVQQPNSNKKD